MKRVFRTTAKHWAQEEGFAIVFGVFGFVAMLWLNRPGIAGLCVIMFLMGLVGAYKQSLKRLEIDEEGILCQKKGSTISIKWSEVLFVELIKSYQQPRRALRIGVRDLEIEATASVELTEQEDGYEIWLPMAHFDHQEIWRLVRQYAPPQALEEDAYQKLPGYQEEMASLKKRFDEMGMPLSVSISWIAKVAYWGVVLGMIACGIALRDSIFGVLLSGFFASLGLWGILTTGKITVDREAIWYRTPIRHYRIKWNEILCIEVDVYGAMAFYGDDKYLVIYGPAWWSGKDKGKLNDFIFANIELMKIKVKPKKVILKTARNVRV